MSFHVPERQRETTHPQLRTDTTDGNNGAFIMPSPEPGWQLAVIASDGGHWEHVSVHCFRNSGTKQAQQRTPSWREMAHVKRVFWDPEDAVMQIFPPQSRYVNCHEHTLHWWRPLTAEIPLPPTVMV